MRTRIYKEVDIKTWKLLDLFRKKLVLLTSTRGGYLRALLLNKNLFKISYEHILACDCLLIQFLIEEIFKYHNNFKIYYYFCFEKLDK